MKGVFFWKKKKKKKKFKHLINEGALPHIKNNT